MKQNIIILSCIIFVSVGILLSIKVIMEDHTGIDYKKLLGELKVDYSFGGDIHTPLVNDNEPGWGTAQKVTKQKDHIKILFSQNDFTLRGGYTPAPYFLPFLERYNVGDTFVVLCHDYTDPIARALLINSSDLSTKFDVIKYLGTAEHEGVERHLFYHNEVRANDTVPCIYPNVIRESRNAVSLELPDGLTDMPIYFGGNKIHQINGTWTVLTE